MKFSEIQREEWDQLAPYLDTCLLPLTGLTGKENPWEVSKELEALRDVMELLEIPYKGRIVTYPAIHYAEDPLGLSEYVNQICGNLKQSGFKYIVIITARTDLKEHDFNMADEVIAIEPTRDKLAKGKAAVMKCIAQLWREK